jgi:hypothetical protein
MRVIQISALAFANVAAINIGKRSTRSLVGENQAPLTNGLTQVFTVSLFAILPRVAFKFLSIMML